VCNVGKVKFVGDKKRKWCTPLGAGGECGYELASKEPEADRFAQKTSETDEFVDYVVHLEGTTLICTEKKQSDTPPAETSPDADANEEKLARQYKSFEYDNPSVCKPCNLKSTNP